MKSANSDIDSDKMSLPVTRGSLIKAVLIIFSVCFSTAIFYCLHSGGAFLKNLIVIFTGLILFWLVYSWMIFQLTEAGDFKKIMIKFMAP